MKLQALTEKFPTKNPSDTERKAHPLGQVPRTRRAGRQNLFHLLQADAAVTVYDGQRLAGVVTKHDGSYTAHDARGRFLGRYGSQREAVAACPTGGAT